MTVLIIFLLAQHQHYSRRLGTDAADKLISLLYDTNQVCSGKGGFVEIDFSLDLDIFLFSKNRQ